MPSPTTVGEAEIVSQLPAPPRPGTLSISRRWSWVLRLAPTVLTLSVLVRILWTMFGPNGLNLVDLRVYVEGSAALLRGDLYSFTTDEFTPDFPLPFTYPPFAALVFLPLHYLPFELLGVLWQLLTIAALYWVVLISLGFLLGDAANRPRWRAVAMLWTALGMWLEPVRSTLDYGQVNVFLVLGAMLAARSSRWWIAGGLVGFVAGIKLTPAITGLYFVAQRRWSAAIFSAVAFAATVGVSYAVIGDQARTYFSGLLGDADRIGPVGSVANQSLRGALSRVLGRDVGEGSVWIAAVVLTVLLAILAWRQLHPNDLLGTLMLVQFVGLLISPISWAHHWVWMIPALIWLLHGPLRGLIGTRVIAGVWIAVMLTGVVTLLGRLQENIWVISRPGVLAWLGSVDVIGAYAVLLWIIYAGRRISAAAKSEVAATAEAAAKSEGTE